MNKKLIGFNYAALIASAIFSILQINFKMDISLLAFPLAALFTFLLAYESIVPLFRRFEVKRLFIVHKLHQYLPFVLLAAFVFRRAGSEGTAYWHDLLSVCVWLISSICTIVVLHFLSPKRIFEQNPELKAAQDLLPDVKRSRVKKFFFELLDWVDAFVQAICMVVLINIFLFQLYEIPSESMVPEFLVRDRVEGFKLTSGPKFPLSDVGLPIMKSYERGDIAIFRNPQYKADRASEIQSFVSQLVYMLTLTMVNLNVDENGNIKADPLVKRVTGVPGEQLMMQDGILYSRTAENPTFTPITDDALWAEWNVAGLPLDTLEKVQYIPLSRDDYANMLQIEEERRALDYNLAKNEAEDLARQFTKIKQDSGRSTSSLSAPNFVSKNDLNMYSFFNQSDALIRNLFSTSGGELWFSAFMTDWIESVPTNTFAGDSTVLIGGDIYSDAMFRQNLMAKLTFGRIAVRTAELLAANVGAANQRQDTEYRELLQQAQGIFSYTLTINDMRNMPVFPPNDANGGAQYIADDHYFMMGDNRFNSLDMRHSYGYEYVPLTAFDEWSLYYDTNIAQKAISRDDILGTPQLRFFPLDRIGVPGLTAEKSSVE